MQNDLWEIDIKRDTIRKIEYKGTLIPPKNYDCNLIIRDDFLILNHFSLVKDYNFYVFDLNKRV